MICYAKFEFLNGLKLVTGYDITERRNVFAPNGTHHRSSHWTNKVSKHKELAYIRSNIFLQQYSLDSWQIILHEVFRSNFFFSFSIRGVISKTIFHCKIKLNFGAENWELQANKNMKLNLTSFWFSAYFITVPLLAPGELGCRPVGRLCFKAVLSSAADAASAQAFNPFS